METWQHRREARAPRDDGRTNYEVDYARIIHSSSFRRLTGKTQIHHGDSDFVRTRMTHSLEVAQLALGIAQRLRNTENTGHNVLALLDSDALIQALGLIHDLGHPPGGHAGEEALNACMHDAGGFEGNGQTLRIIAKLESNTDQCGANLTRRTMLGVLKYPVAYSDAKTKPSQAPRQGSSGAALIGREHAPPKCYHDTERDVVDWLFSTIENAEIIQQNRMKSFDCQLLDLADDLAYSVADCDDAIALGMLKPSDLLDHMQGSLEWMSQQNGQSLDEFMSRLYVSSTQRKRQIGAMINALLGSLAVSTDERSTDPLYRYRLHWQSEAEQFITALKRIVFNQVIMSSGVQHDRMRIQTKIVQIFDAMSYRPHAYLPEEQRLLYRLAKTETEQKRVICDYIAGMTDRYLIKTHQQMMG